MSARADSYLQIMGSRKVHSPHHVLFVFAANDRDWLTCDGRIPIEHTTGNVVVRIALLNKLPAQMLPQRRKVTLTDCRRFTRVHTNTVQRTTQTRRKCSRLLDKRPTIEKRLHFNGSLMLRRAEE
jgi:hypothetical protein